MGFYLSIVPSGLHVESAVRGVAPSGRSAAARDRSSSAGAQRDPPSQAHRMDTTQPHTPPRHPMVADGVSRRTPPPTPSSPHARHWLMGAAGGILATVALAFLSVRVPGADCSVSESGGSASTVLLGASAALFLTLVCGICTASAGRGGMRALGILVAIGAGIFFVGFVLIAWLAANACTLD
jgi:hypothetical protein